MLNPIVFSTQASDLGEGPLWSQQRSSLFWIDILNKVLYEKSFDSQKEDYDNKWNLPYTCSALAEYREEKDKLYLLTEHSFGWVCLKTGCYSPLIELPIKNGFRTNDGGVAPDGSFWFGTMQKKPNSCQGEVFSLSSAGKLTKQLTEIGIPNTFCWSKTGDSFYLSDSFRQKLFAYPYRDGRLQNNSEELLVNLSESRETPDGGAMDLNNHLWNAQWDGEKIACYDEKGVLLDTILMPIPKPTSCCFGGAKNEYLFITSAKEDMTDKELEEFPFSGMIFMLKLSVSGRPINPFYLETNQ